MRAVTRRHLLAQNNHKTESDHFDMAELRVLPRELRATRDGQVVELSLRDVRILKALHDHPGEVLDRDALFNAAWDRNYLPSSRTLDQHISKLRKRIEADPKNPRIIQAVHGAGYRFPG